ncbi:MAG: choice-of-anchor E domain-containing protein [Pseudomonadota bacterium]
MFKTMVAAAFAATMMVGAAQAATQQQDASDFFFDESSFLEFDQFDVSDGFLTQVDVTVSALGEDNDRVEGFGDFGAVATASSGIVATVFSTEILNVTVTNTDGCAGNGCVARANATFTESGSATFTDASALLPFLGSGTFQLSIDAIGEFVTVDAEVIYTFVPSNTTPVPLPAGLGLLLPALGGLALVARRRKAA